MIQIQNLHFAYKKKKVFDGLTLSFSPGHIYGLLGKNGTGKSTLLRNICGLLFPDKGSVQVLNQEPGKRKPSFLQQVFLIPEEFDLPNVSINSFIKTNASFYPLFNLEQFNNYLREFDIPIENTLLNMSYGQKKKVLIAFGLSCNTKILLLDEPTNGLDIISKSQFRKVIAGSVDENKCIIISTHQVKDLESLIDRITVIDEGNILFDESIENISRKLSFKVSFDSQEAKEALYAETGLKGNLIVAANTDGTESRLDIELLYKTIVSNQQAVYQIFNTTTK
jgi:ABC-2 type transport system ATP-binding protein